MSDITITIDNLSRFNKRLQKALKSHFNQDVPLHIASNLFANALGVDDEYQLKKKLEINHNQITNNQTDNTNVVKNNTNTTSEISINYEDIYVEKAQSLLNDIHSYFAQGKSLFNSFEVYYIDGNVSLHINAQSKKLVNSAEGFGLYFEDNPIQYFKENLNKLKHSKDDLVFLENLCKKYFTDDYDQNIYVGSRFIRLLGINPRQRGGQVDSCYLYRKNSE